MERENQLEVIKYLKSVNYQTTLKKYNNQYEAKKAAFEAKYASDDYKTGDPEYSELAMQSSKLRIFRSKIDDIQGESRGAILVREMLEEQAENISSHLHNSVTNSFGGSKDVAVFTADDIEKFKMLHEKDFHIFIVGMMNPGTDMSVQEKYDIYEDPEDQIV